MQQEIARIQKQAQRGLDALRRGDFHAARQDLGAVLRSGRATVLVCVMLALACQRLDDRVGMDAALERALALEPANVHALILKGELLLASGEPRSALEYFDYALAAAPRNRELPGELAAMLERARSERSRISEEMHRHLLESLHAAGYAPEHTSRRFTHAVDLLTGRRQIYTQQPRAFYFPELPNIQFYPREQFAFLDAVESATDAIEAELHALTGADEAAFQPYLQSVAAQPGGRDEAKLARHSGWKAAFLLKSGVPVAENVAHCPRTLAVLEHVPLMRVPSRGPNVLFSLLRPGQRIEPHCGFLNSRLIVHLPLVVPRGCRLRVGNETREWERGKALVFDDSIEHEAWNETGEPRVVLLFDIWRPEFSEEERLLTSALLASADGFGGSARSWAE